MKRKNFPKRKEQRQQEAKVRQAARNKLTDAEQLAKLEAAGYGECKEAEKLYRKLAEGK